MSFAVLMYKKMPNKYKSSLLNLKYTPILNLNSINHKCKNSICIYVAYKLLQYLFNT